MHIGEYIEKRGSSISPVEAIHLWHGTVACLKRELPSHTYHARLEPSAFAVEGDEGALTVTIVDRSWFRPAGTHEPRGPLWPFAAPEQTALAAGEVGVASNVYTLGLLGSYLFTGERPYPETDEPETDELELAHRILRGPLPAIPERELSKEQYALLTRILRRSLEQESSLRYSTLSEMQGEIGLLLGSFERAEERKPLLVGRQRERVALLDLVSEARSGSSPFRLLLGEPGEGKSFLWHGIAENEPRRGEGWCFYKSPQTGGYPYAGVASLLRQLLSDAPVESAHTRSGEISPSLRAVLRTISPELEGYFPEQGGAIAEREEPTSLKEEAEIELARLFAALSGEFEMVLLALDDIQWLDQQSLGVLTTLAKLREPGLGVLFIGRPEGASRVPEELRRDELLLTGLKETEGEELLRWLLPEPPPQKELTRLYRQLDRYAKGNPLAIMQLSRIVSQWELNEEELTRTLTDLGDSTGVIGALARSRLQGLSAEARRFLRLLSLLLPPVHFSLLDSIAEVRWRGLETLLEECESSLLIIANRGSSEVLFAHDSIEASVREEASDSPELVSQAVRILYHAFQVGSERALFALARLLSGLPRKEGGLRKEPFRAAMEHLSAEETVELLARAATRSLTTMAPKEALAFSESALSLRSGYTGEEVEQQLLMVAHEAAFRLDDPYRMSRHFARIFASRDTVLVNQARQLWISKAYSESAFGGAIRIGWKALEELGSLPPWRERENAFREAERAHSRRNPGSVKKKLMAQPLSSDPIVHLRIRTAARLLLPMLTVDHDHLPLLVDVIVRESLENGRTGYTGIAYIAWMLIVASRKGASTKLAPLSEAARELASRSGDPVATHVTNTYARIFSLVWVDGYGKGMGELLSLYREGYELGNFQFASHTMHLYSQALLYHGAPLTTVLDTIVDSRSQMIQYHHHRTAKALAKYQQGVECLLGRAPDPLVLTGSVIEESSYLEDLLRREDHLSISGFYMVKGLLASYEERPALALSYYRKLTDHIETIAALHDNAVGYYLWGVAACREGAATEARQALRKVRRWARGLPENHAHRLLGLEAEVARSRGRRRRAERLYEKARLVALRNGYPHEAALIAEGHASLLSTQGRSKEKEQELLYLSQSLYSRWGAHHAADRVRRKLHWEVVPERGRSEILETSFVRGLTEARTDDEMIGTALREICRLSGAEQGYLTLRRRGRSELYLINRRSDSSSEVIPFEMERVPLVTRRLLEQAEERKSEWNESVRLGDRKHYLLSVASGPSSELSLRILLLTHPGGANFSDAVRGRVTAAAGLTAAILRLRASLLRNRRQEEDLQTARQEVAKAHDYSRTLFGTLSDALLLLDEDGRILSYNPATSPYLVFGKTETVSLDEKVAAAIRESYRMGEERGVKRSEIPWNERDLRISVTPAHLPEEPVTGVLAVTIEEITELKRKERALRRREKELILADRMSSIGMLSATIAHEVSNPNHILQLNAQSLLMVLQQIRGSRAVADDGALANAEEMVEQIVRGSERIESVVNGIKEYGRGGRQEEWEITTPEAVCRRAYRFSRIMAAQYTNHLILDLGEELPRIRVLGGLLEQAVVNLIKNSCEALFDSSGRVRLSASYDRPAGEVVIAVSDDGGGLDPRLLSSLGKPFESGREEEGGTGLGLSIVGAILERHGGSVLFREDDEYMTVAELRLPPVRE